MKETEGMVQGKSGKDSVKKTQITEFQESDVLNTHRCDKRRTEKCSLTNVSNRSH